ncbi:MAG: DUF499 domain-containing protein [Gammaproteobacteria bacterium]|nr:DUF499 domain-containing protein [Gammaproteobacteria bacterium]MYJ73861.1 DUF499 domain-containing protein [Gammaproteobacteria bacterium]
MSMAKSSPTPWWETIQLRDEITDGRGRIDDVQASLHDAVFGRADGLQGLYGDADLYGQITHPTGSLVALMAQIAVRLGSGGPASTRARAVWRLDQAMGGGKSHGLIGLWHLAVHTDLLAATDLGVEVFRKVDSLVGSDAVAGDLGGPRCVVLDCDNPEPREKVDGPATTLGERFLWRLFEGAYKKWETYKDHVANKESLAEALHDVGRPVLILIDEIMDYIRWASNKDEQLALTDMAFLRALLDVVNDVDNCVLVVVMIASDRDRIALNETGQRCRGELEDLLVRNGEATTVSGGGDFAEIIRRRLFAGRPPTEVVSATAQWFTAHMGGRWGTDVFAQLGADGERVAERVARCYPFHPSLIRLAEEEWSQHAGFQRVRSTIQVFAATVYELAERGNRGKWVPQLIGPGDLPLSARSVRDSLLDSGLVTDHRAGASLREIATAEIADPDHPERGVARRLDLHREPVGWNSNNPRAAERAATALFVYSICPRPGGRRGATLSELVAAAFVPSTAFGPGDAEVVWTELSDPNAGLTAIDMIPGRGGRPARWVFETRQTLRMLQRREREAITDAERDEAVTSMAFDVATSGPFDQVVPVDGGEAPVGGITFAQLRTLLEAAGIDDRRSNRLVILDSRWFSLNGGDSETRAALQAAFGLGDDRLAVSWASSAVFACINTQRRSHARAVAADYLAAARVRQLDAVKTNDEHTQGAAEAFREAETRLKRAVLEAYHHIAYLADDGSGGRADRHLRFQEENQSALHGAVVWPALDDVDKAFGIGVFDAGALLHNLREQDWGLPLSELRDMFWNTPRVPLLPEGERDLRRALFEAIAARDIEIVDSAGETRTVTTAADINLGSSELRIQRPPKGQVEVPNVTGQSVADARAALQQAGLTVATATAGATGVVTEQDASPGAHVDPGATITLTLQPKAADPKPSPTEHQVALTITKSLSDAEVRNAIWRLFSTIADAIDTDASHIQMTIQLTTPTATKDKITEAAGQAGQISTVRDL